MKVIGLIGGVSWESSAEYYRLINEEVKARLGIEHSAKLVMYSLDFQPVSQLEHEERWDELTKLLADAANRLERAGADFVIIASNTLHKVANELQRRISVPLLHIADATAEEIKKANISLIGLLGTRFVMEQDFYRERLSTHGLKVVIPDQAARDYVHNVIYKELSLGRVLETSKQKILGIITELAGAEVSAVMLANTELPLLLRSEDTSVRLFDTMAIHAKKAVSLALSTSTP